MACPGGHDFPENPKIKLRNLDFCGKRRAANPFSVHLVPLYGNTPMLQTILRWSDLEKVLKLKHSAIYDRVDNDPSFPKPIRLGKGRAVGWIESEIIAWQQKRIAERDKPAARPKRRRASKR
jgi:prophage regulatory protein